MATSVIFVSILCLFIGGSYGQSERCGVLGDCFCRSSCWDDIEDSDFLGGLLGCSRTDLSECCCSRFSCGLLDDCDCRRGDCEDDEYRTVLWGCENSSLTCCCYDDGGSGDEPEMVGPRKMKKISKEEAWKRYKEQEARKRNGQ